MSPGIQGIDLILWILTAVSFGAAIYPPPAVRFNLIALGLFLATLTVLIP